MTEEQKQFRIKNLQNHIAVVGRELKEKTAFLCETQIIPLKTLHDTTNIINQLQSTLQGLSNLGLIMFGKDWTPVEQSKIVSLNGTSHNLGTE